MVKAARGDPHSVTGDKIILKNQALPYHVSENLLPMVVGEASPLLGLGTIQPRVASRNPNK